MPVPIMQLITSATRSHRRTARISPACFCIGAVAAISYINLSSFAVHPAARDIVVFSHENRYTTTLSEQWQFSPNRAAAQSFDRQCRASLQLAADPPLPDR